MWNLLKSELLKLRRCQILLVGLVALALCPLVQYGSQLIVEAEYRNPNYDFSALFENVVWGNTQIFLPISLVMIGGWLIDRESTHDTLKNIMTIPVSMPKMLGAKLLLVGMLAVLLGIYSVGITLITGLTVGLSGLTAEVFLNIIFVNAFFEEFFFRGFVFRGGLKIGTKQYAYLFSAVLFALYHVTMIMNWFTLPIFFLCMAGLFAGGLIFNYVTDKCGSIFGSYIIHAAANLAINAIGLYIFMK